MFVWGGGSVWSSKCVCSRVSLSINVCVCVGSVCSINVCFGGSVCSINVCVGDESGQQMCVTWGGGQSDQYMGVGGVSLGQ